MATILVVEDDVAICNLLRSHLEGEGYTIVQAFDGPSALALVAECLPHLVILDWMLPGLDGLAVCRRIREAHLMPIIMLTARNEEIDRVLGLEVGADDYIAKPFSIREVLARVRAILRRVALDARAQAVYPSPAAAPQPEPQFAQVTMSVVPAAPAAIARGPLCIDPATHTVTLDGAPLDLTPKEYDLLSLLAEHTGRAFSRDFLLERLWGHDYAGFDRVVDTHVARLRKKLGPLGDCIVPVRGVGYRFAI
jgi:DNA-binding response OmpR family regulator